MPHLQICKCGFVCTMLCTYAIITKLNEYYERKDADNMAEKKGGDAPLTYKGRPLLRNGNELYYGDINEPYMVSMQILSTKEEAGEEIADKVYITLLSNNTTLSPKDRIIRKADRNGLYNALEIASIWLERALSEA